MISKNLTSKEILFVHEIIEDKFQLPRGHVKIGELETLLTKSEGIPFSGKQYDLFKQAAILFEGIVRIHIFTDGNKRTALEVTRQFLNRNDYVFIIPLSGTNFIYKIARSKTTDTDKIISQVANWLDNHSAKTSQWYAILGLLTLHLYLPASLVNFFAKIRMIRISRWIMRKYIINDDPKVTDFMLSIYEKQFNLFESAKEKHKK